MVSSKVPGWDTDMEAGGESAASPGGWLQPSCTASIPPLMVMTSITAHKRTQTWRMVSPPQLHRPRFPCSPTASCGALYTSPRFHPIPFSQYHYFPPNHMARQGVPPHAYLES